MDKQHKRFLKIKQLFNSIIKAIKHFFLSIGYVLLIEAKNNRFDNTHVDKDESRNNIKTDDDITVNATTLSAK